MTVQLALSIKDDVSRELRQLADFPARLGDILDDIGGSVVASTQQRFLDEQTPTGAKWDDHSDTTKAKRGNDANILRDHNHLFDSLDHKATSDSVAVGTNMTYGRIHQFGGMAGRGRQVYIPARPYLGLNDTDRQEIAAIVADHMGAS